MQCSPEGQKIRDMGLTLSFMTAMKELERIVVDQHEKDGDGSWLMSLSPMCPQFPHPAPQQLMGCREDLDDVTRQH